MNDRIVGIDLGTSNTVVAYVDELDRVRLAADADGHTVHPSVVSFHPNGGVVVGVAGKARKVLDPKHTVYSAKRMIGQPFRSAAVQETARRVPFEIFAGANEQAMVRARAGEFAIPEISAIVLDHARKLASTALKTEVARAVVTVPASFTDVQRSSTATAGALAGLTVVRVLNEPTAAAIAYGSSKRLDEIIAVYDWGGGTFDITILKLQDQVYTVLGTSGDAFLGGEDMDERLVTRMADTFLAKHRIDLRDNEVAMMRLRAVAEHTKIELTRRSRALVKVEEIAFGKNGKPIDLEATLTRDEFISSIGDLIERTFSSCKEALVLAGIGIDRVADVVLVGGTTRIPIVREQVAKFFRREARSDMSPEDAIATGAALTADSIEKMLAKSPQRPMASVQIPLDDFEEDAPGAVASDRDSGGAVDKAKLVEVEPVRTPSRIGEVKRPKRGTDMFGQSTEIKSRGSLHDPEKTTARAKEFFGDLFGDKPAKPESATPAPKPPLATMRVPVVPPPRPPAPPSLPEPSLPVIELADLEPIEDEFDEKSGELLISVDESSIAKPLPRDDKSGEILIAVDESPAREDKSGEILIAVDEPSIAKPLPRDDRSGEISIAVDEASVATPLPPPEPVAPQMPGLSLDLGWDDDPSAASSGSLAVELDEPRAPAAPPHPELSREIDLVMPPPKKSRRSIPELDMDIPSPKRTQLGVPVMAEPPPERPRAPAPPPARAPAAVIDVTPRGLGIGTVAGFAEELIRRNAQLPAAVRRLFSTGRDLQDTVRIVICQGESRRLENNTLIGELVLENLPRRRRGETQIDVEFRLDASGILHVSARDVATGTEQRARLDLLGGMAPEDMSAAANRLKQLSNMARD